MGAICLWLAIGDSRTHLRSIKCMRVRRSKIQNGTITYGPNLPPYHCPPQISHRTPGAWRLHALLEGVLTKYSSRLSSQSLLLVILARNPLYLGISGSRSDRSV